MLARMLKLITVVLDDESAALWNSTVLAGSM